MRRLRGPALTAVLATALAACGSDGSSTSSESSPVPSVKAPLPSSRPTDSAAHLPSARPVDELDASEVVLEWARLAYSYDTMYDIHPHTAFLRADRYLTVDRRAAERAYRPASAPGAQWGTWSSHAAWITAAVELTAPDEDTPADTTVLAYRAVVVQGAAHGRDGWKGTGPRLRAYLTLVREEASDPWRISQITTNEATD
ncbi:hypothetical protein J7F01_08800 [Streptomyces sp. ISL-22]|uniref:hypothetical protein n=1 Tax=unclassified Streptomyces TaxID=2593676 RepID=UPI001BE90845|nr:MULTISPECIES: hypothetical protein [unclassified Streptomyces]MBT2418025.1 hypothetical protein [Streptomyces sp. ISL-24]MBT2432300.1 hypothetical protein [Streptomyces sp. ISL-22]